MRNTNIYFDLPHHTSIIGSMNQEKLKVLELTTPGGDDEYNAFLETHVVTRTAEHLTKSGEIFCLVWYTDKTAPIYTPNL